MELQDIFADDMLIEMIKDWIYNPITIGICIVGLTLIIMNWLL